MKQAIDEYQYARVCLTKAFRKMGYRIEKLNQKKLGALEYKWHYQKKEVFKQLRKMDSLLRDIITSQK